MKSILVSLIIIFSVNTFANSKTCPDFSGTFTFKDHPWNGYLEINQQGCDKILIRKIAPEYKSDLTFTYLTDGRKYQGPWYKDTNNNNGYEFESSGLAGPETSRFHKAEFEGNSLKITKYDGQQSNCSEYTFTISECEKWEIRYDLLSDGSIELSYIATARSLNDFSGSYFKVYRN